MEAMSSKKRKMDDGEAAPPAAPPQQQEDAPPSANAQETPASAALATGSDDVDMTSTDGASSMSESDLTELVAQLPSTIGLLQKLSTHLDTCRTKPFHALRKEVLRLAAGLQNAHFAGDTKDDAAKRQHRRREKSERAARELKAKADDQKYINSVALRNSRIQALNALVEPEGWGEKKGDQLLMPGEAAKLLMPPTAEEPNASPDSALVSASPAPSSSPEANAFIPTAEVLAAAAGPQSYTYPTIAPTSHLAELVSAEQAGSSLTKPFLRTPGQAPTTTAGAAAGATAVASEKPSVLVPPLPSHVAVEDESAAAEDGSKAQPKKKKELSARQAKKAMFNQEGIHVNTEALQASIKKEKEEQQKLLKASASDDHVPMDTSAAALSGPSLETMAANAAAAAAESDPAASGLKEGQAEFGPVLNNPRSCYCCKARFYRLHFFYSEFCGPCARLNYAKRNQLADLRGKVVLLTGSRVKIGFRCGLRLLRCGALLIATSRFPHDTAKRYAAEKDFDVWKSRLHIYGLDLRDLKSVVKLSEVLSAKYDRLDAIINNAAQTVRRPAMYYRHLLGIECMKKEEMPDAWQEIVKGDLHELAARKQLESSEKSAKSIKSEASSASAPVASGASGVTVEDISHEGATAASAVPASSPEVSFLDAATLTSTGEVAATAPSTATGLDVFSRQDDLNSALATSSNRAAVMSQLTVLPEDQQRDAALFPENRFDVTGQQLDLRSVNSWNLTLDQVDPSELVEVFAINALSPFILNSRLKGLMLKGGRHPTLGIQTTDKYIINVSAMEGKFYRHKSPYHPHTNAAKAALNMLTRTSAQDYAKDRIYMNSVDTGWINDENPHEVAKRLFKEANFQTPIDEEDAMARILDPLLSGITTGINPFGKFFKDYHETEW